ncbi:VOC family protein [Jiangella mangrovi]|uniref:Methylmalonyl-CoA/ethylmalonyl-CoA epimerase n=1 Tax=Jiangella mangrovi TaxID=1524084 RepID=A0A7W9GKM1_9ACTN|nr:VOC family protein [Jiangella mangrovi]MBB5785505.1 methylmalonyl-CoA/ethylmalonyl-CoA epimerase [Jiangella mangrovi]
MSAPHVARRIDHVGLVVRDADAVIAWHTDRFGLVTVHDEVIPGDDQNVRLVFLAPPADQDGTALQLVSPIADGPIARYLAEHGEGLHHVCYAVDDVEAALVAAGDAETRPFVGGKGRRCAFPTGVPAGVRLELVEEEW